MTNPVPESSPPAPQVATYISRPVSIEAVQWDGTEEHARQLCDWADSYRGRGSACFIAEQPDIPLPGFPFAGETKPPVLERPAHIVIGTLEGHMKLEKGAWLIKGTEDEFYPCKDTVFQAKYQHKPGIEGILRPHILIQNGQDVG